MYIAEHMIDPNVQTLLRVILGYTGFPGWFGVDEDESEVRKLSSIQPDITR